MTGEAPDPVMETLARLSGPAPRATRDALVRARCHAVVTAAGRPQPFARQPGWALDRLLPAAVVAYGVVILVEGLRMAGLF